MKLSDMPADDRAKWLADLRAIPAFDLVSGRDAVDFIRWAQNRAFRVVPDLLDYIAELETFVRDVWENYDHDGDAHKHNKLPACRACNAETLIGKARR